MFPKINAKKQNIVTLSNEENSIKKSSPRRTCIEKLMQLRRYKKKD